MAELPEPRTDGDVYLAAIHNAVQELNQNVSRLADVLASKPTYLGSHSQQKPDDEIELREPTQGMTTRRKR